VVSHGTVAYQRNRLAKSIFDIDATTSSAPGVVTFGNVTTLEDLGVNYRANAPAFTQDRLRQILDGQMLDVERLCK
jgi:hypothetical protein